MPLSEHKKSFLEKEATALYLIRMLSVDKAADGLPDKIDFYRYSDEHFVRLLKIYRDFVKHKLSIA